MLTLSFSQESPSSLKPYVMAGVHGGGGEGPRQCPTLVSDGDWWTPGFREPDLSWQHLKRDRALEGNDLSRGQVKGI